MLLKAILNLLSKIFKTGVTSGLFLFKIAVDNSLVTNAYNLSKSTSEWSLLSRVELFCENSKKASLACFEILSKISISLKLPVSSSTIVSGLTVHPTRAVPNTPLKLAIPTKVIIFSYFFS